MRKLATKQGQEAILLFVAELNGYKKGNVKDKLVYGEQCWIENKLPHEPHERIWAERMYKELYLYEIAQIEGKDYYWSAPIELDVAASMLQIIGALLGDEQLLTITNCISDGTLNDPWGQIPTVSRKKTKAVLMPQIYGSSKAASQLLDDAEEGYTAEEIIDLEAGINKGAYGVANAFKRFLIANCNMKEVVYPVVKGEKLEVPCNRHHVHGEKPVLYKVVDNKAKLRNLVHWNTVKTADLKAFKRWTVTGLVHGLDARILDFILTHLDWAVDIHDAVICNPEDAMKIRIMYADQLNEIYENRQEILNEYFKSVGVRATLKVKEEWEELKRKVTPVEGFKCSLWAMK
jgi:hypothetical protein